jgi:hypothetical protein
VKLCQGLGMAVGKFKELIDISHFYDKRSALNMALQLFLELPETKTRRIETIQN